MTDAVVLDFSGMFESKPKGPPPKRKAKPAAEAPPLPTAAGAPPVLTLQQFGLAPKVDFGDAPAGAVTSRTLVVDNDGSLAKRLEVKGVEKRDALRVYPSSFEVAAGARRSRGPADLRRVGALAHVERDGAVGVHPLHLGLDPLLVR